MPAGPECLSLRKVTERVLQNNWPFINAQCSANTLLSVCYNSVIFLVHIPLQVACKYAVMRGGMCMGNAVGICGDGAYLLALCGRVLGMQRGRGTCENKFGREHSLDFLREIVATSTNLVTGQPSWGKGNYVCSFTRGIS